MSIFKTPGIPSVVPSLFSMPFCPAPFHQLLKSFYQGLCKNGILQIGIDFYDLNFRIKKSLDLLHPPESGPLLRIFSGEPRHLAAGEMRRLISRYMCGHPPVARKNTGIKILATSTVYLFADPCPFGGIFRIIIRSREPANVFIARGTADEHFDLVAQSCLDQLVDHVLHRGEHGIQQYTHPL